MPKTNSGIGKRVLESERSTFDSRNPQEMYDHLDNATDEQTDRLFDKIQQETIGDREQDNDVQRFFNHIGWANDEPEVLSEKEFQQAYRDAGNPTRLYHSDYGAGGITDIDFANQFMGRATNFAGDKLRHFISNGYYGGGTYFANSAEGSKGYGSNQFRGFLNSNARIIDFRTLQQKYRDFSKTHPRFAARINAMTSGYGGNDEKLSMFAAMMGYNVISVGGYSGYTVVLNRKAVTVSTKMKKTTNNRYMRDW